MPQRRQARAQRGVFQRDRGAEHRHDAVASELVHCAAIALHHRRRIGDEFGHDLEEPLRTLSAAAMSIEWTTSANNTVACLYSAGGVLEETAAPHSLQNLAFSFNAVPHDPHDSSVAVISRDD